MGDCDKCFNFFFKFSWRPLAASEHGMPLPIAATMEVEYNGVGKLARVLNMGYKHNYTFKILLWVFRGVSFFI